jgi:hypothetical protein
MSTLFITGMTVGFFTQIFMENFDGILFAYFDNRAIPDNRKLSALSLVDERHNGNDVVELIMDE